VPPGTRELLIEQGDARIIAMLCLLSRSIPAMYEALETERCHAFERSPSPETDEADWRINLEVP